MDFDAEVARMKTVTRDVLLSTVTSKSLADVTAQLSVMTIVKSDFQLEWDAMPAAIKCKDLTTELKRIQKLDAMARRSKVNPLQVLKGDDAYLSEEFVNKAAWCCGEDNPCWGPCKRYPRLTIREECNRRITEADVTISKYEPKIKQLELDILNTRELTKQTASEMSDIRLRVFNLKTLQKVWTNKQDLEQCIKEANAAKAVAEEKSDSGAVSRLNNILAEFHGQAARGGQLVEVGNGSYSCIVPDGFQVY